MAKINVSYTIANLDVTVAPGERFTFRRSARDKDYFILVMVTEAKAVMINVQTGTIFGRVIDLTWTEHIPMINDPNFPESMIVDPDKDPTYTADLADVIEELQPGTSIKQFIKAGWRFDDHGDLMDIVRNEV